MNFKCTLLAFQRLNRPWMAQLQSFGSQVPRKLAANPSAGDSEAARPLFTVPPRDGTRAVKLRI